MEFDYFEERNHLRTAGVVLVEGSESSVEIVRNLIISSLDPLMGGMGIVLDGHTSIIDVMCSVSSRDSASAGIVGKINLRCVVAWLASSLICIVTKWTDHFSIGD